MCPRFKVRTLQKQKGGGLEFTALSTELSMKNSFHFMTHPTKTSWDPTWWQELRVKIQ